MTRMQQFNQAFHGDGKDKAGIAILSEQHQINYKQDETNTRRNLCCA
jgi:hypothetical protein